MTLPTSSRVSEIYTTNGTQKDFSFGFRVFYDPENGGYGLEVRRQTETGYEVIPKSQYDVIPSSDSSSGIIRFYTPPASGMDIYIAGLTKAIQQLDLTNYGRYSAESIETQFDYITAIIQEWISSLGEETRQRIASDEILNQYVVQRIDDFVQQVNQNWDAKSQEIEDYIATIMPSFTQTLREEIEAFAVAGMQDAIDQTLADSKAEIDDAVARANAAALAAAISGKVYDTPEAGVNPVTGVADGAYFNVRSPRDESYVDEYQNVGGVATPTGKSYPSSSALNNLKHNSLKDRDAAGAHPASSIQDESGLNQQEINDKQADRNVDQINARDWGILPTNSPAENSANWFALNNAFPERAALDIFVPAGTYKFSEGFYITRQHRIIGVGEKERCATKFDFQGSTPVGTIHYKASIFIPHWQTVQDESAAGLVLPSGQVGVDGTDSSITGIEVLNSPAHGVIKNAPCYFISSMVKGAALHGVLTVARTTGVEWARIVGIANQGSNYNSACLRNGKSGFVEIGSDANIVDNSNTVSAFNGEYGWYDGSLLGGTSSNMHCLGNTLADFCMQGSPADNSGLPQPRQKLY